MSSPLSRPASALEDALLLNGLLESSLAMRNLLQHFSTPRRALEATSEELACVENLPRSFSQKLKRLREGEWLKKELEDLKLSRAFVRALGEKEYPENLSQIPDPPLLLYGQGEILDSDAQSVAIVGSRRPTPYGLQVARQLSRELAEMGITIVSGLARGIDTEAHLGALEGGGRTLAVLGSGLLEIYPPENRRLAEKIKASGALLSEFPLRAGPRPENFPRRNRIISGLSLGLIVVEAQEASGALITAHLALEQGREVFAVPGSLFSKTSIGPHNLIREGATLVRGAQDVVEQIEALRSRPRKKRLTAEPPASMNEEEAKTLAHLEMEPVAVDLLAERCQMPVEKLAPALLGLILKGAAREFPGKRFARTPERR